MPKSPYRWMIAGLIVLSLAWAKTCSDPSRASALPSAAAITTRR